MVPISSAASLLFCFFLPSFLPQHLDCSISHWIILGRTSEEGASEASGGEIKQPLADPTRLRLWWRNGGKRRGKSRQSLLLSERLSESGNDATIALRHGYCAILRMHLNTLAGKLSDTRQIQTGIVISKFCGLFGLPVGSPPLSTAG